MGLLIYILQYIDFSDLYETLDAVRRVARHNPNEENVDTDHESINQCGYSIRST